MWKLKMAEVQKDYGYSLKETYKKPQQLKQWCLD